MTAFVNGISLTISTFSTLLPIVSSKLTGTSRKPHESLQVTVSAEEQDSLGFISRFRRVQSSRKRQDGLRTQVQPSSVAYMITSDNWVAGSSPAGRKC